MQATEAAAPAAPAAEASGVLRHMSNIDDFLALDKFGEL